MLGVCKWFNERKGYGFITRDDNSENVFVHFKDIRSEGFKKLNEGDKVEFELMDTPKGLKAINVTVAK